MNVTMLSRNTAIAFSHATLLPCAIAIVLDNLMMLLNQMVIASSHTMLLLWVIAIVPCNPSNGYRCTAYPVAHLIVCVRNLKICGKLVAIQRERCIIRK